MTTTTSAKDVWRARLKKEAGVSSADELTMISPEGIPLEVVYGPEDAEFPGNVGGMQSLLSLPVSFTK